MFFVCIRIFSVLELQECPPSKTTITGVPAMFSDIPRLKPQNIAIVDVPFLHSCAVSYTEQFVLQSPQETEWQKHYLSTFREGKHQQTLWSSAIFVLSPGFVLIWNVKKHIRACIFKSLYICEPEASKPKQSQQQWQEPRLRRTRLHVCFIVNSKQLRVALEPLITRSKIQNVR